MNSRVVISGIGVVSPIGAGKESFWRSCIEGRSGVVSMPGPWYNETGLSTRIAAVVNDFDASAAGIPPKAQRVMDRTTVFALAAAREALLDAGFSLESRSDHNGREQVGGVEAIRLATVIGSGIGGLTSLEASHAIWRETRSKHGIKRFSLPMLIPNAQAGQVAIRFGAMGECKSVSTACAAGTMALGDAYRILERGEADVVIAGGAEGSAADADGFALMGFERLRTLSTRNDEPERASRPFDKHRDGFVLGEGACVLILERAEFAEARGAKPYCEVAGYAANCDAHSMMQLDETGSSLVRLLRAALESAGIDRRDVDYFSAHGTSTLQNDRTESKAMRMLFEAHCDNISVTALKSMTGHGIAASGPMETAAAAMSLQQGILTPTINYDDPDPECNVDVVGNTPRERRVNVCLKPSYGFGGHNGCLVLTRV